jgi:hypothetical protein
MDLFVLHGLARVPLLVPFAETGAPRLLHHDRYAFPGKERGRILKTRFPASAKSVVKPGQNRSVAGK